MEIMHDQPRGNWVLVRAYKKRPDLDKMLRAHQQQEKKKPAGARRPFIPPTDDPAPNTGYISWKDKKSVVLYTNNLAGTPSKAILTQDNKEAITCVHSLVPLRRWTGTETMHRT